MKGNVQAGQTWELTLRWRDESMLYLVIRVEEHDAKLLDLETGLQWTERVSFMLAKERAMVVGCTWERIA